MTSRSRPPGDAAASASVAEEEKVCCQIHEHLEEVSMITSRTTLIYSSQCGHAVYSKPKDCWKIQHVQRVEGHSEGKQTLVAELHYKVDNTRKTYRRSRPLPPVELVESLLMTQELKAWVGKCMEAVKGTTEEEERRDRKVAKIDCFKLQDQFGETINFAVFVSMLHRKEDGPALLSRVLGQEGEPDLWNLNEYKGWMVQAYSQSGQLDPTIGCAAKGPTSSGPVKSIASSILENVGWTQPINKRPATGGDSSEASPRPKRQKLDQGNLPCGDSLFHSLPPAITSDVRRPASATKAISVAEKSKKVTKSGSRPPALESSSESDHTTDDEAHDKQINTMATAASFEAPVEASKVRKDDSTQTECNASVVTDGSSLPLQDSPSCQEREDDLAEEPHSTVTKDSDEPMDIFATTVDTDGSSAAQHVTSTTTASEHECPQQVIEGSKEVAADAMDGTASGASVVTHGFATLASPQNASSCQKQTKGGEPKRASHSRASVATKRSEPLKSLRGCSSCHKETTKGGDKQGLDSSASMGTKGSVRSSSSAPSSQDASLLLLLQASPSRAATSHQQQVKGGGARAEQKASAPVRLDGASALPSEQPKVVAASHPRTSKRHRPKDKMEMERPRAVGLVEPTRGENQEGGEQAGGKLQALESAEEKAQESLQGSGSETPSPTELPARSPRSITRGSQAIAQGIKTPAAAISNTTQRRSKRPLRAKKDVDVLDSHQARPAKEEPSRRSLRQRKPRVTFAEEENEVFSHEPEQEDPSRRSARTRCRSGSNEKTPEAPASEQEQDSSPRPTRSRRSHTSAASDTVGEMPPPADAGEESSQRSTRPRRSRHPVERFTDVRSEKIEETSHSPVNEEEDSSSRRTARSRHPVERFTDVRSERIEVTSHAPVKERGDCSRRAARSRHPVERFTDVRSEIIERMSHSTVEEEEDSSHRAARSRRIRTSVERYTATPEAPEAPEGDSRACLVKIKVNGEESLGPLEAVMTSEGIPKRCRRGPQPPVTSSTNTYSFRARTTQSYYEDDADILEEPSKEEADITIDDSEDEDVRILVRTPFVLNRKNFLRVDNLVKEYEEVCYKRHGTCFSMKSGKDISAKISVDSLQRELDVLDRKYPIDEEEEDEDIIGEQQLHNKTLRVMQGRRRQEESMRMKEKEQAEHMANLVLHKQWTSKKKAPTVEELEWEEIVDRPIQFSEARTMRGKRIAGKESCPCATTATRRNRDEDPPMCRLCYGVTYASESGNNAPVPVKEMMPLFHPIDTDAPEFLQRDEDDPGTHEGGDSERKAAWVSKRMKFDPRRRRETKKKIAELRLAMDFIDQYNYGLLQKATTGS